MEREFLVKRWIFFSRFLQLSVFPWCKDRLQKCHVVVMIKKINMASNQFWHIGVFFPLNLLDVRVSSPPIFSLFCSCWSSCTVRRLCNRWCPGNNLCFYLRAFEFKFCGVFRSHKQLSYTYFWKKREKGCIFFLEPDVFGICGVIYCVMLFPSSLWGTLGNPRDRPCNDICD